jgi:hypothetical protein
MVSIPMTPGPMTAGIPIAVQSGPFGMLQVYPTKASEFMFKQFEGFKDFTMNTAKSGLSVGEKTAFWMYAKVRAWSRNWFTHIFLFLVVLSYSLIGTSLPQACRFLPNPSRLMIHQSRYVPQPLASSSGPFTAQHLVCTPPPAPQFPEPCVVVAVPSQPSICVCTPPPHSSLNRAL